MRGTSSVYKHQEPEHKISNLESKPKIKNKKRGKKFCWWLLFFPRIQVSVNMSFVNQPNISQIVKIYRSLDGASDATIRKFVNELEPHHIKWIISKYLKQFLPYYDDSSNKHPRSVKSPPIDYIHAKNLREISTNDNDSTIFEIMNNKLVNKYFSKINNSSNPLSINTLNQPQNNSSKIKVGLIWFGLV